MLANRTRIGSAIDKEIYQALQQLSKETDIPISKLLDRAILNLINEYKKQ